MLIVVVGSGIGGSLAMGSSPTKGKATASQGAAQPQIVVVTTVPGVTPSPVRHKAPAPKPSASHSSAPRPTSPSTSPPPAIAVSYKVDSNWGNGFQAEVDVTNNTSKAIPDWQIVVSMPRDQFTGWWNASGYANNGVLLLSPPSWVKSVKPDGGTWRVYFNANGTQTKPTACAFNGVACSE